MHHNKRSTSRRPSRFSDAAAICVVQSTNYCYCKAENNAARFIVAICRGESVCRLRHQRQQNGEQERPARTSGRRFVQVVFFVAVVPLREDDVVVLAAGRQEGGVGAAARRRSVRHIVGHLLLGLLLRRAPLVRVVLLVVVRRRVDAS
jgi:hypothetical protein